MLAGIWDRSVLLITKGPHVVGDTELFGGRQLRIVISRYRSYFLKIESACEALVDGVDRKIDMAKQNLWEFMNCGRKLH